MPSKRHLEIDGFFKPPQLILIAVGVIFYPNVSYEHKRHLLAIFIFSLISVNVGITIVAVYGFQYFEGGQRSLIVITDLAITVCYGLLSQLKLFRILMQSSKVNKMLQTLSDIFPTNPEDDQCSNHFKLRLYYRRSLLFTVPVVSIMFLTACAFCGPLAIEYMNSSEIENLADLLPYRMWYPYEISSTLRYWLTYAQQMHAAFISSICTVGVDSLLTCILMQLCMHLDALSTRLLKLDARDVNGSEKELIAIIKHHELILSLLNEVNKIFAMPIFITVLIATALLCFGGFQVTEGTLSLDYTKFVMFLLYELASTFQICRLGDMVTTKSLEIGNYAYRSNWYEGSAKYQKVMRLLILRSQKAGHLDALTFHNVSLHTFSQITTSAYRFFALLRTMYSRT